MCESVIEQRGQSFYPDISGYFNRITVHIDFSKRAPTTLAHCQMSFASETFNNQNLIIALISFPVIPTFCEDHFLPSVMIIGLACIHQSIGGQISKLVDSNNDTIRAFAREFLQSGNKSSRWILVHKDHNSSCQMFSALKCNIVNLPH